MHPKESPITFQPVEQVSDAVLYSELQRVGLGNQNGIFKGRLYLLSCTARIAAERHPVSATNHPKLLLGRMARG